MNTFNKQPATLKYQASKKIFTGKHDELHVIWEDMIRSAVEDKHVYNSTTSYAFNRAWCCCTRKETATLFGDFSCNYFQLTPYWEGEMNDYTDLNCDPIENTIMALQMSEFEPIWFYLLNKVLERSILEQDYQHQNYFFKYVCKIKVSVHWWEVLARSGFFVKLSKCLSVGAMKRLLQKCGDIELNPGPTYKEVCQRKFKRNLYSDKREEWKAQKQIERQIRLEEEEYVPKNHKKIIKDVEMQMFGTLGTLASITGNMWLGAKTNNALDKATKSIDTVTTEITKTLDQFRLTFANFSGMMFKSFNILDIISDIIFALLQLSYAKYECKIKSLTVEFVRIMRKYGFGISIDYIRNLIMRHRQPSMQIDGKIDFYEYLNPTTIVSLLFVVLSTVFTTVLPKKTHLEEVIKRCGELGRSSKGIKDLNDTLHESVGFMLEYFKVNVLGLTPTEKIEEFISGIDRWFDDVRNFLQRKDFADKKSEDIMKDPNVLVEVENIYKRGLEFSREISDKKLQRELTLPFQTHMKYVTDLMKLVDTSGAFGSRPRTQPIVIWLYGESGVGKSGMSWPLAVDLNNIFVPNAQEAKEFSKNIYMRNVEQEFWDNYQGQNVVIYDDFGQLKDSQSTPNMEFMELIRTANIAPYPLHMAHLEDKRKTRFTSKIVLLTSNVFNHSVSSLTFPDAFRRRIDLCARVYNKDEFTKVGYSDAAKKSVKRLDKEKVMKETGKIISTDVYLLDIMDPESGALIEEGITYDEFLEKAQKMTKNAFKSSKLMNEFLEQYAETRFEPDAHKEVNMQVFQLNDKYQFLIDQSVRMTADNLTQDDMLNPMDVMSSLTDDNYQDAIHDPLGDLQPLSDQEIQMIIDGNNEFEVYDVLGHIVDVQQFISDQYDRFLNTTYTCFEDFQKMTIQGALYLKRNTIVEKLLKAKNHAMTTLQTWGEKVKKFVMEHPFVFFASIFSVLSGILCVSYFWTKVFPKPNKVIQTTLIDDKNVKIIKSEKKCDLELSHLTKKEANTVLNHCLDNTVSSVKLSNAWPEAVNIINSYAAASNRQIEIVTENPNVNRHGKQYKLEATSSGDPNTLKPKSIKIEATTSGDPNTLKPKVLKLEATTSGDPTTTRPRNIRIEATSSSDAVTLRHNAKKFIESFPLGKDEIDAEMQMWKDQVAQNLITNRIFSNLYKIGRKTNDEVLPLLNGLFIRGNIMLVPGHLRGFLNQEDVIELRSIWDVVFEVPVKDIKMLTVVNALGESKEAMLLVFPRYVSSHSDLVKHFSNGESMGKYKRADVCLPLIRYSEKMKKFLMMILGNHECRAYDEEVFLCDKEKGNYVLRQGLEYKCPTIAGDCGAPVIVNETQVLRKIAGIHVAGDKDGMAYAESITQKDLERTLKKIDASLQIKIDLDGVVKHLPPQKEIALNEEFDTDVLEFCDLPAKKLVPVGRIPEGLREPGKTEIRPSLIFGMIDEIKTKPAYLRNVCVDGEYVNIKHKNLQKCAMDTPYIDKDLLNQAYTYVKPVWLRGARKELQRVLTWEETVMGSEDSEYISSINRSSSPGYPWILQRQGGTKGKQGWFGDEEFVLNEEVRKAVEFRVEQAKQGIRVPTLWVDTLKDERRPIEKVDALKTRVFSNGPMDFSLAFRQYYLGFIAHLMENRITNEVSIGTNVYSQDWRKTAKKLLAKGKKVIAGDFSTFDGSLNSGIMALFANLANEFYDDGEENALVRHVLLQDVYNSMHICGDSVYGMTHSQPSGNPATTPLNCFVNSMTMRMVFVLCAEQAHQKMTMKDFDKHVSMVSYGDDNVVNFSDEVCGWFNMDTITAAYARLGFTYTDEAKSTNGTVPIWRDISQVAYLKRNFRYDDNRGVWEAPLAMDTILEMPNWCRGGLDILEGTKCNAENAIMELSMHEEPVFDFWSKKIANAFYAKTGECLAINTYRGYAQDRYLQYYLN
jgi:hypothetical protein